MIRAISLAMPDGPVPLVFDRARVRRRRDRAAARFRDYGFLKDRVSTDILDRLNDTPRMFETVLDIGAHDGALTRALRARAGTRFVAACDLSPAMAARCGAPSFAADDETLPVAEGAFDLVTSALSLHWPNDLPGALVQINRTLKPDGLFLGAVFGAGTLAEWRDCLIAAETETRGGAALRVSPLPGLQDMAGLMQRAGFALPVADVDHVTVRYATPFHLLADLKGMGERAAFADPAPPLRRDTLMRAAALYAEKYSDPDGRVRASFEIIHVSGWSPGPGQPKPKRPGSATARLADALGTVERKTGG